MTDNKTMGNNKTTPDQEPATPAERQREYRNRVKVANGEQLALIISRPAVFALREIQIKMAPTTKKAAIEAALIGYAESLSMED